MQTRFPTFPNAHRRTPLQLPAPPSPGAPRCGRRCRAWGRHGRAALAPLPLPGDLLRALSVSPPPRSAQLSLSAARPLGAPPARQSPLPRCSLRDRGTSLPPFLPAAPGAGRGRTWDVGVGSLLVGQLIPAAQRRLRAPALHQESSGHGEGRGQGWARSGAALQPRRPPAAQRGCTAVRGSGTARTGQSR